MSDDIFFDDERYVGMQEAVVLSGLSKNDIENLVTYGVLPGKLVAKHWYVSYKALMDSKGDRMPVVEEEMSSKAHAEFIRDLKKEMPQDETENEEDEKIIPIKVKTRARRTAVHASPALAGIVALLAIGATVFQSPQLYAVATHALQAVQTAAAAMGLIHLPK